jgi:hypothetical protein
MELLALISKETLSVLLIRADEGLSAVSRVEEAAARDGYAVPMTNNIVTKYRKSFAFMLIRFHRTRFVE